MKYYAVDNRLNVPGNFFAEEIMNVCRRHGDVLSDSFNDVNYILNFTSSDHPRAVRRKSKSVFVVSVVTGENYIPAEQIKDLSYNTLIRTLSNLLIYISPDYQTYFTTPEAGFYEIIFDPEEIYKRMLPIVSSHFATDNIFINDMPPAYWHGSEITEQIKFYGKYLDRLGVLPVPFSLKTILTAEELSHLYKIFGITGASYGNLSAREKIMELGENTFWMTGRGVDKSDLNTIGKDILLVKEFDFAGLTTALSMPPVYDSRSRVSVDAVEHALIYKTFPDTGAIVHVHAWIDEVLCTHQNYPCGTIELAREVVDLFKKTEDPSNSAIGLKNHGLTITGRSLPEIFERVSDSLVTQVEMFA